MASTDKSGQEITAPSKREIDISKGEPTFEGRYFSFSADIVEDSEAVTVIADMPGVSPNTLDIDLRDNELTILGRAEGIPPEWRLIHGEYELGGYMRKFNVGSAIDQDKIVANMKDGVLTLVLAKAERLKPRKIEVSLG